MRGNDGQVKRVSGIRHIQVETVLAQGGGYAFLPSFLSPELRCLLALGSLGSCPFVLPSAFDTFFWRELGGSGLPFCAPVPAFIVLIAAALAPYLAVNSFIGTVSALTPFFLFLQDLSGVEPGGLFSFGRLAPGLVIIPPGLDLLFGSTRGDPGLADPWLPGLRLCCLRDLWFGRLRDLWFGLPGRFGLFLLWRRRDVYGVLESMAFTEVHPHARGGEPDSGEMRVSGDRLSPLMWGGPESGRMSDSEVRGNRKQERRVDTCLRE